jgi:hypothetical protein
MNLIGSDQPTKFYRNPGYGTTNRSDRGALFNQQSALISILVNIRGRLEASGGFNHIPIVEMALLGMRQNLIVCNRNLVDLFCHNLLMQNSSAINVDIFQSSFRYAKIFDNI